MGEGIADENLKKIITLVEKDADIEKVINIHSNYQSPDEVILMLIVAFNADMETEQIVTAINRLRKKIRKEFPRVRYIMIEPQELPEVSATSQ